MPANNCATCGRPITAIKMQGTWVAPPPQTNLMTNVSAAGSQ